jgi:hypothetical protein
MNVRYLNTVLSCASRMLAVFRKGMKLYKAEIGPLMEQAKE